MTPLPKISQIFSYNIYIGLVIFSALLLIKGMSNLPFYKVNIFVFNVK